MVELSGVFTVTYRLIVVELSGVFTVTYRLIVVEWCVHSDVQVDCG